MKEYIMTAKTHFTDILQAGCFAVRLLALSTLFIVPLPVHAQRPFTCEDQFFLTIGADPSSLNEVIIDPLTEATVFRSINSKLPFGVNAAGYRWKDNFIYCINPDTYELIRLDADGRADVLAKLPLNPLHSYFAGDITPDGRYLVLLGSASLSNGLIIAGDLVRVDLDDPKFGVTIQPLDVPATIYDIAFHPLTDVLYGYDSSTQRLVRIDPLTGAITSGFPRSGLPFNTGSLFFDAYGNLYAYGSVQPGGDQNSLYEINIQTGVSKLLTRGEAARASDGCSCPYTVELSKSVSPRETLSCSEVDYTFKLVNSSRRPQFDLRLEDRLPAGFVFVSVVANPLGGTVRSEPGDNSFILEDLNLPGGSFEVVIRVRTGKVSPGIYRNQARLLNLPASLGESRRSDDLSTIIPEDSTALTIVGLPFGSADTTLALCAGAGALRLDAATFTGASPFPVQYTWQSGQTGSSIDVETPGTYRVWMVSGCDSALVTFRILPSSIEAKIVLRETQQLALGDSIFISSAVRNSGMETRYRWVDPQGSSLNCPSCPATWARPFNDITYRLEVSNELGCTAVDSVRLLLRKNRSIYFPNVFSPDSRDQANAWFYGSGDTYVNLKVLAIYSRWGELLFEARNVPLNEATVGWSGDTGGSPAPPGVYVWKAVAEYLDGVQEALAGDVTLLR